MNKFDGIGAAVVLNRFAFAFNEFVHAFTFLPKKGQLSRLGGHQAKLVALGVLAHVNFGAAYQNRAFGEHHFAREDAGLL